MTKLEWFNDLPVLGALPPEKAIAKLRELGEVEAAASFTETMTNHTETFESSKGLWPFKNRAWQHTSHAFGFIDLVSPNTNVLPIRHAGNISADETLKNARIKITLDRLRVSDYPGGGLHHVLFDFYAQNQVRRSVEHLHFNATHRIREGEQAALLGFPLFVGLNVGTEGVVFKCFTVNIKNETDEALLSFLETDVFKEGLKLTSTAQPVIGLFSQTALGLTKAIAARTRNVPVQDFYMGLDFSKIPTRARLAEGSYIAVQIPETHEAIWDWRDWNYNQDSGQIINQRNPVQLIPYNYIVFSVSRYGGN